MRRPGLWVANGSPGNADKMLSWRPGALTSFFDYLGPNRVSHYKEQHPEIPVIIRFQHPRNWHENPTQSASSLGDMVASKWPDIRDMDPYVYFANEVNLHYENGDNNVGNQPKYETASFYQTYANWVRMTADRIKQRAPDMKLVTPPFAFGHHEDGAPDDAGNPTEGWAGYDYLADTVRSHFNNILTFHAYWGHASGSVKDWLHNPTLSSWYAFRWRRVLNLFERRYGIQAKMLIDEAGNMSASDEDFTDQVIYHARQCLADDRVLAVTYFLWEDPTYSPGNLPNSWVQRCKNLDDHVARLAAMPDVAIQPRPVDTTQPTMRVLMPDGSVKVLDVEEYLRGVVPSEMSARWPIEALKTQAVAARSYAMVAKNSPRHHPNADICTTTHCQVYNPDRINPMTDRAIELTRGQVIMYGGQVARAYYSANCGGSTVSNKEGFGGAQLPYLVSVPCINHGQKNGHGVGMCQWGAHDMAERGDDYVTILKHYYSGVSLSTEAVPEPTPEPEPVPEPEPSTGIIYGKVVNQNGVLMANVKLQLVRDTWRAAAVTDEKGAFKFDKLPTGIYTLEALDYDVKRGPIVLGSGGILAITLTAPTTESQWKMTVERKAGLPILAGSLPEAGVPVTLRSPLGNTFKTLTGSKPEYGAGGFEFWAPNRGKYQILFMTEKFELMMDGQFTQVSFTKSQARGDQAMVSGVLRDHTGTSLASRQISLTSQSLSRLTTTDSEGVYRFDDLPAGAYTITVVNSTLSRPIWLAGSAPVTLNLTLPAPTEPEPEPEPTPEPEPQPTPEPESQWLMKVVRGAGLPMIVGSLPEVNIILTILPPMGTAIRVLSGSKPAYGVGGFEAPAPQRGIYTLQFLDQTFKLSMDRQFTRITFVKGAVPIEGQARLVSTTMTHSEAQGWLGIFEADDKTTGLFTLEEV